MPKKYDFRVVQMLKGDTFSYVRTCQTCKQEIDANKATLWADLNHFRHYYCNNCKNLKEEK